MDENDVVGPEEPAEEEELDLEGEKKKKDLIDEDTESLADLEEDELEEEEEPFDDVTNN